MWFTGPQSFHANVFKPVVTEVDVERLASVAVQEVCVHSQAHLVLVDLQGQTQSDFAFLCGVTTVSSLLVYLGHVAHILNHHTVVLRCLQ